MLISKYIRRIMGVYFPFNMSYLDKKLFIAIQTHDIKHVLARTPSKRVAQRFLDIYGFISCLGEHPNPLKECKHYVSTWNAKFRCLLDDKRENDRKYTTTSPVLNALRRFNAEQFKRIVKDSGCYVNYAGSNNLLYIAMEEATIDFVRVLMEMSGCFMNMGYIIHERIIAPYSGFDDRVDMLKTALCAVNPKNFKSLFFEDSPEIFCACLRSEYLRILLDHGMDLNYIEDNLKHRVATPDDEDDDSADDDDKVVFEKGFIRRFVFHCNATMDDQNDILSKKDLADWKITIGMIKGNMSHEGREEVFGLLDSVSAKIDAFLSLPDNDPRFMFEGAEVDEVDESESYETDD